MHMFLLHHLPTRSKCDKNDKSDPSFRYQNQGGVTLTWFVFLLGEKLI